jgi:hypothetical protein
MKKLFLPVIFTFHCLFNITWAQSTDDTYSTAIVIGNRAGADLDEKIPVLEDLITARVADLGFNIISQELVIGAASGEGAEDASSLEAKLNDQSSALRIAQGLNADYILSAFITSFSERKKSVSAYGVQLENLIYTLRVSYKIVDVNNGGALTAGVAKAEQTEQNTEHSNTGLVNSGSAPASSVVYLEPNVSDIVDNLLDEVTVQIGEQLRSKLASRKLAKPSEAAEYVTIEIDVETADLYVPDVRIGPENTVTIKDGQLFASPVQVTVEVDGVAVGMAPGKVQLKPGFSQLRLSRSGYRDWERTINAREGQTLSVAMEMSDEGIARWAELTVFFNSLKNGAKLTDAKVKEIEGKAKMLSQSGYKVDIKVDTAEGITIENNRSIFGLED